MLVFPYILPSNLHGVFSVVATAVGCSSGSSCVMGARVGLPFGHRKWYVNFGVTGVSQCLFVTVACVLVGGGVTSSILSCVRISDAFLFLDACFGCSAC